MHIFLPPKSLIGEKASILPNSTVASVNVFQLQTLGNCRQSDLVWTVLWAAPGSPVSLLMESGRNHNNQTCLF